MIEHIQLVKAEGLHTIAHRTLCLRCFERQCEHGLANLAKIHALVGNDVDAVFLCGTDFGTQTSTFCSTQTFDDLWFPYYKKVNDWIHANTSWKCFKHSCGSVERFIPSFIDAGFDILNPVQCSAANMGEEHLKSSFGESLSFWGGGVDTQKVLPLGTPETVREHVRHNIEVFGSGTGGFVFTQVHNIQYDVPPGRGRASRGSYPVALATSPSGVITTKYNTDSTRYDTTNPRGMAVTSSRTRDSRSLCCLDFALSRRCARCAGP